MIVAQDGVLFAEQFVPTRVSEKATDHSNSVRYSAIVPPLQAASMHSSLSTACSALCDARSSGGILAGVRCSASVHAAPDTKLRFITLNDYVSAYASHFLSLEGADVRFITVYNTNNATLCLIIIPGRDREAILYGCYTLGLHVIWQSFTLRLPCYGR